MITLCKGKEDKDSVLFKIRQDGKISYKRVPFKNYFYVKSQDYDTTMFLIKSMIEEATQLKNGFTKLILKNNFWRKKCYEELISGGVTAYEADINSVKRFFIDNPNILLNQKGLKICFMDIETYDYKILKFDGRGYPVADLPITSVAITDTKGNESFIRNLGIDGKEFDELREQGRKLLNSNYNEMRKYIKSQEPKFMPSLYDGEYELLKSYKELMKNEDLVLAYNGDKFDFSYIKQRMEFHNIDYYSMMTNDMDYMNVYKKNSFASLKRWGLNPVSKYVFADEIKNGEKKTEEITKLDWKEITPCRKFFEMFLFYPEMFKEYNLQDVRMMKLMEDKLHFIDIHILQTELCHCPIEDTIYNSRMCDYLMLNEKKKIGMVSNSKPDITTIKLREKIKPGGGFTYCNFPGIWNNIVCFDFLSHYPTTMINFNISPEKYYKDVMPDLSTVLNDEEINYLNYCCSACKDFLDKKGDLNKKKYEKKIEEERLNRKLSYNIWDIMWKFVENYNVNYMKDEYKNYCITPADINYDTRGWTIHPHRLYKNDSMGLVSGKTKDVLFKRIEVKNEIKRLSKLDGDYKDHIKALDFMKNALKILINSFYGYFAFRSSREYLFPIPDSITASCRFITKSTMVRAKDKGLVPIWGDTDSCYFAAIHGEKLDSKVIDGFYFDFFKDWFNQFNTIVSFDKKHPLTGEEVKVNHTTEFNFEKELKRAIDIKKKKYYFLGYDKKSDKWKMKVKGASSLKSDTLQIAAEFSKKLAKDVLFEEFEMSAWKDKILELKKKVYSFELSDEDIIKFVSITKPLDAYGGAVIDGSTGKPKVKRNGEVQVSGVPAHIKVAMAQKEKGIFIDVGDKVGYVIVEHKPRISAISVDEYMENKRYDADYYWECIESSILEVLEAVCPKYVYSFFKECWSFSEKVQERLHRELAERFLNYDLIKVFGDMSSLNPMNEKCGAFFG
jgi:DNA polymerase elongation subunit (family B)